MVLVQDWDRVRKSRRCGSFFGFNKFQRRDLWFTAFEGYCNLHLNFKDLLGGSSSSTSRMFQKFLEQNRGLS